MHVYASCVGRGSHLLFPQLNHFAAEIDAGNGNRRRRLGSYFQCHISRAGGDIEYAAVGRIFDFLDGKAAPASVYAETQNPVEKVIAGGDGVEHFLDLFTLFREFKHFPYLFNHINDISPVVLYPALGRQNF